MSTSGGAPAFRWCGGGDRAAILRAIPPAAPAQADAPTTETHSPALIGSDNGPRGCEGFRRVTVRISSGRTYR
jgi:hypothetical protein